MTSSDSSPKLPIWIFALTDVALLGAAGLIALQAERPLSSTAVVAIVACVVAGAIVLFVPLVARYERQKNETLDERQRALEGLAATVAGSAEQISVAASGLHGIADLVQKNLRHAEQLPHKLQDKIAEFKAQLDDVTDTEKEELEKELVSLRSSESERLEATSTKIAKAAAELAKLEAATQQHLSAANEALAKLSMGTAAAIGKAQAAAEQALAQARTEAARGLGETAGQAARAIEVAKATALVEVDARIAAASAALIERLARDLGAKLTPPAPPTAEPPLATPPTAIESAVAGADLKPDTAAHPPKRPRKPRRDETEETSSPAAAEVAAAPSTTSADTPPAPKEEPAPIPSAKIPEVTPVAPDTAQPFVAPANASASATPAEAAGESQKIPRRRAAKKAETEATPVSSGKNELDLGIEDAAPANGSAEKTLSSDGATRLLVTAYIGIGNRLFIRGTGPGLSWEKGVPLQFVSIGKWRWETNDATAPVQFKLYKNDDTECTALGAQSVAPGYQQEVTAAF